MIGIIAGQGNVTPTDEDLAEAETELQRMEEIEANPLIIIDDISEDSGRRQQVYNLAITLNVAQKYQKMFGQRSSRYLWGSADLPTLKDLLPEEKKFRDELRLPRDKMFVNQKNTQGICLDLKEKVIIFTDWPITTWNLEFLLIILGLNVMFLGSQTSLSDRGDAMRRFDNPDDPIQGRSTTDVVQKSQDVYMSPSATESEAE